MKIFKALLVVSLIACNAEGGEEFNLKKIDNLIGSWHKETSTYYFLDGAKTEFDKSKNEELVFLIIEQVKILLLMSLNLNLNGFINANLKN